jgi:nuclear cap-binding protein subunit 1
MQVIALRCVGLIWSRSPLHQILICDKLTTNGYIDSLSIVNWIFSQDEEPQFCSSHLWQILVDTIDKLLMQERNLIRHPKENEKSESVGDTLESGTENQEKENEAQLAAIMREKKQLFLIIFQRFSISIGNRLTKNDDTHNKESQKEASPPNQDIASDSVKTIPPSADSANWLSVICGYLLDIGRRYCEEIEPLLETLTQILFTDEVDPKVMTIFKQFRNLAEVAAHYQINKSS